VRVKKLLPLLLLSMTAFAANAGDLHYSYVEAGYAQANIDSGSEQAIAYGQWAHIDDMTPKGAYGRASVSIGDTLYVLGDYRQGKDTTHFGLEGGAQTLRGSFDADVEQGSIGLGGHYAITDSTDLIGEVAYVRTRVKLHDVRFEGFRGFETTTDATADDARVSFGVRSNLGTRGEGWVLANYVDGDAYDSDFGVTAGGQLKFNQTWGLVGEAIVGSTNKEYRAGIRASF
jgi:hypothetical protein